MSRRLLRREVPVHFDGKVVLVKNVTKYTTCGDVVHMLLLKSGLFVKQISSYALFEATDDLERMLPGRARIMKTLRSWGCEKDNFRLVLRNTEEDKSCKLIQYKDIANSCDRNTFAAGPSGSNEELHKKNVHNARTGSYDTTGKQEDCVDKKKRTNIRFIDADDKKTLQEKNGKHFKTCDMSKSKGKQICLRKYLSNLIPFRKQKRSMQTDNKSKEITKIEHTEPSNKDSKGTWMAEIDDLLHKQIPQS